MAKLSTIVCSLWFAAACLAADSAPKIELTEAEQKNLASLRLAVRKAEEAYENARASAETDFLIWLEKSPEGPTEPDINGEVARFTFEEVDGHRVKNAVARGLEALVEGGPRWTEGKAGAGMQLDGKNRLRLAGIGNVPRTDPFTLSLWLRISHSTREKRTILHRSPSADAIGYEMSVSGDHVAFAVWARAAEDARTVTTTAPLQAGQWNHIAAVSDGAPKSIRLFVNGRPTPVADRDPELMREADGTQADLVVGGRAENDSVRGIVDDLRVFDRDLSTLQIAALAGREDYREAVQMVPEPSPEQRKALMEYYIATSHTPTIEALEKLRKAKSVERAFLEEARK